HTSIQMIADSACKHTSFNVATFPDKPIRRVEMAHALHILFDDRALIEIARDVVGGRSDELYATIECLVIGLRALEARQEGVVNVDATAEKIGRQFVGKDLHVAGENHQVGSCLLDDAAQLLFLFRLRLARDGKMPERQIAQHDVAVDLARVVGDDTGYVHGKLAGTPAVEQIDEAVIEP